MFSPHSIYYDDCILYNDNCIKMLVQVYRDKNIWLGYSFNFSEKAWYSMGENAMRLEWNPPWYFGTPPRPLGGVTCQITHLLHHRQKTRILQLCVLFSSIFLVRFQSRKCYSGYCGFIVSDSVGRLRRHDGSAPTTFQRRQSKIQAPFTVASGFQQLWHVDS